NNLQNRAASQFLRGISLSRQPKGKAEKVIKEFNEANSIFLSSEADFVLLDQKKKKRVTEAKMKGTPNHSNADKIYDNAQESFYNNVESVNNDN
ncbi:28708_t:CDS:2, partial [Racocetra persica]